MEKKRNLSSLVMRAFAVLFCLTLLSLYLMSNMYARYTTEASGEDGARVAAYVFQLKDSAESMTSDLNKIRKPGDSQTYTFAVTNKRDNVISEVAQSYTIKLEVEGSMPIECKIEELDASQQDMENPNSVCEVGNIATANSKQAVSAELSFPAAEESTMSYKLTAKWPQDYNDAKYASASGTSVVTLTVEAQQTD